MNLISFSISKRRRIPIPGNGGFLFASSPRGFDRFPMKRLYRILPVLIPLALLLSCAEYARRRVAGATEQVRKLVILELSRAMEAPVEVGKVSGSVFGNVRLDGIVVGRDANLPGGAIFQTTSMTIGLKLLAYLRGEVDPEDLVTQIQLDRPELLVTHAANGYWNVQRWIKKPREPLKPFRFHGRLIVRGGKLNYRDDFLAKRAGDALITTVTDLAGTVRFAGEAPVRFAGTGRSGARLPYALVTGWLPVHGGAVTVVVRAPDADAAYFAHYFLPHPDNKIESGRADGEVTLTYGKIDDRERRFSYAGDLRLRNVVVSAKQIAPRRATGINGPVSFNGRHITLNSVTGQVGSTIARVTGTFIAIPSQPQFDLEIESGHASLAELAAVARQNGKLAEGTLQLVGDAFASGRVRVTGRLDDAVVSGSIKVGAASATHPTYGTLGTGPFALRFGSPSYASGDYAADFSASVLDLTRLAPHKVSPHFAGLEIGELTNVALKITGFPTHTLITGNIHAPRVQLGGTEFTNVMASARYHDGFLGLTNGHTEVGGGTASGEVQVQLAQNNPVFGVRAKFERVELHALDRLFQTATTLQGVTAGELIANGTPREMALDLTAKSDSVLVQWDVVKTASDADDPQDAARDARQLRARRLAMEIVGNYERDEQGAWKFAGTAEGTASAAQLHVSKQQREGVREPDAQNVKFKVSGDVSGSATTPLSPRPRLSPHLAGTLEAERGSATFAVEPGASPWKLDAQSLSTDFSTNGQLVNLTNLRARALAANWRVHVDLPLNGDAFTGKFSGDSIDLKRFASLLNAEGLEGSARVQGELHGTLDAPIITGEVEGLDVRAKWLARTFRRARARATWSDRKLTVHEASAWSGGARVSVEGEFADVDFKNRNATLRISGALTGGDLRDLLATSDTQVDAEGVVAANVQLGGTIKQPSAAGHLELSRAQFKGVVFDRASVEGSLRGDTWEVSEASAKVGDAQLQGAGTYRADDGVNARWSLANAPAGLLAQFFGAKSRLTGRVTASGTLSGKYPHETIAGGLHVIDLRVEGKRFGELACAALVDRRHLEIEQASMKTNGHARTLVGFFPFKQQENGLDATLHLAHESVPELIASAAAIQRTLTKNDINSPAMQALLDGARAMPQPLGGRVSGEASVTGSWEHPRLSVRALRVAEPSVGGEPLPAVKDADFVWDGEHVVFQRLEATDEEESIVLRPDSTWSREKIDLSLKANNVSIRHLRPWLNMDRTTEGKINAFVSAKGPAAAPQVEATVEATDLRYAALPLESARARLSVNRNELTIHESELVVHRHEVKTGRANVLLVNGTMPVRFQPAGFVPDRPLALHVRAEPQEFILDPDVTPMLALARGDFAGEVNVTGTIDHPRLGGEVSIQGATLRARSLLAEITDLNAHVEFDASTNSLRITRAEGKWHLGTDEARLSPAPREPTLRTVAARVPEREAAAFALTGHAELTAERLFDWRAHHYDVQLQFSGGSWTVPRFSGLRDIRGKISFTTPKDEAHRITIESLTARDSEAESLSKGRLSADGTIDLLQPTVANSNGARSGDAFWKATRLNVNAHATEFVVRQAKLYDATLTGQMALRNDPADSAPVLNGEIRVPRASVAGFPGQTSTRTRFPRLPKLDVAVMLGNDVLVRNPTFEALLGGKGTIRGTPDRPDANFEFNARRGTVRFPGTELRVTDAAATAHVTRDADGNLTPLLMVNLRAEGKLDSYRLVLTLEGPVALNDPKRSIEPHFFWDGPAGQNLYTRLLGLPRDDPGRGGERQQQIAGEHVLAIFQAPLVSGITEEFRRAFGLQVFGLDYRVGEPTAIQFGKEVTRNMFVLYRKQVSGTTQLNTLRFEYRIKGRLLLGYQTDEREHILSLDASFRF